MQSLDNLKISLMERLEKPFASRAIMDRFRLMDEADRQASSYSDPLYAIFYYHLGREIQPKTMLEFGFRLGLFSGCFLYSCKTVEKFLAFQEKKDEYYSSRIGKSNIRDHYKGEICIYLGKITDDEYISRVEENKWELVIINEELGYDMHMSYLDIAWQNMDFNGIMVMDYLNRHEPAKQAFLDFCKAKSRQAVTFNTRYGVGLIQK